MFREVLQVLYLRNPSQPLARQKKSHWVAVILNVELDLKEQNCSSIVRQTDDDVRVVVCFDRPHHHHQLNVHFLPRLIKGMDGCFPTAYKVDNQPLATLGISRLVLVTLSFWENPVQLYDYEKKQDLNRRLFNLMNNGPMQDFRDPEDYGVIIYNCIECCVSGMVLTWTRNWSGKVTEFQCWSGENVSRLFCVHIFKT